MGKLCVLDLFSRPIFGENKDIKKVIISEGFTNIDADAFRYCDNLTEVLISNTVKKIESGAFRSSGLIKINIPQNVSDIAFSAFESYKQLQQINIDPKNNFFLQIKSALYTTKIKLKETSEKDFFLDLSYREIVMITTNFH